VLSALAPANRGPALVADPEVLDLSRKPGRTTAWVRRSGSKRYP
jgi:hypothetical protein